MELAIAIIIAFFLCLMNPPDEEVEVLLGRDTRLNPDFYEDEDAFMEVAHGLGFSNNSSSSASADTMVRVESVHTVPSDTENNVRVKINWNSNEDDDTDGIRINWNRNVASVERTDI